MFIPITCHSVRDSREYLCKWPSLTNYTSALNLLYQTVDNAKTKIKFCHFYKIHLERNVYNVFCEFENILKYYNFIFWKYVLDIFCQNKFYISVCDSNYLNTLPVKDFYHLKIKQGCNVEIFWFWWTLWDLHDWAKYLSGLERLKPPVFKFLMKWLDFASQIFWNYVKAPRF